MESTTSFDAIMCIDAYSKIDTLINYIDERHSLIKKLSGVIRVIPKYCLTLIINMIKQHEGFDFISIGSGYGVLEKWIMNNLNINIICIDPNPDSFPEAKPINIDEDSKKPNYDYVKTLVNINNSIIDNSILMINWPWCPSKNDGYDVDSIILLRPKAFVIFYETIGGSGGVRLLIKLNKYIKTDDNFISMINNEFSISKDEQKTTINKFNIDENIYSEKLKKQLKYKLVDGKIHQFEDMNLCASYYIRID